MKSTIALIRPAIKRFPGSGEIQAPPDVNAVLKKACYDYHSNKTKLGWAVNVTGDCAASGIKLAPNHERLTDFDGLRQIRITAGALFNSKSAAFRVRYKGFPGHP